MRIFLMACAFVAIFGCAKAPYFDLRHPVYFKAENSFWAGCDKDPLGDEACRKNRIEQMYQGFDQWFDYFGKDDRPQAVFISSDKELPVHPVNSVIYLGMSDGFCGKITGKIDHGKW